MDVITNNQKVMGNHRHLPTSVQWLLLSLFVECLPATIYIRGSNKIKLLQEHDECVLLGELPD